MSSARDARVVAETVIDALQERAHGMGRRHEMSLATHIEPRPNLAAIRFSPAQDVLPFLSLIHLTWSTKERFKIRSDKQSQP